jgi:hypothetical protein
MIFSFMAEKFKPIITDSAGRRIRDNIEQTEQDALTVEHGDRYKRRDTVRKFSKRPF